MFESTIAAIATPPGQGGIAVVRLSGPQALAVGDAVFRPVNAAKSLRTAPGYTALFGHFMARGRRCDETVALVFRAPKSYTGEDVVELSCHGGTAVVEQLLEACLAAGAQMAGPGEFTRRAFENGRLTLTQAEAVMDMVQAQTQQAAAAAAAAMDGALWREVQQLAQQLQTLQAHIAAWVDWPEEEVPALQPQALRQSLCGLEGRLARLTQGYTQGEALRRGVPTALIGGPNVGKSTILNLLAGRPRAIVTPVAGTTRDVLEVPVRLGNTTLLLADTAGLRETADPVEQEGVRRTRQQLEAAALVLAVFDTSVPLTPADRALARQLQARQGPGRRTLFLFNKQDLPALWGPEQLPEAAGCAQLCLAAVQPQAAQALQQAVERLLGQDAFDPDAPLLANRRQLEQALAAQQALRAAQEAMEQGLGLDAVGVCLQDALAALGQLSGTDTTQAVIDEVFSRFCVGK